MWFYESTDNGATWSRVEQSVLNIRTLETPSTESLMILRFADGKLYFEEFVLDFSMPDWVDVFSVPQT